MASLTVRELDESLKLLLRMRAAAHNRSMEEEARQILRAALQGDAQQAGDLGQRIHARFKPLGGVDLPIAAREPVRDPPDFKANKPRPRPRS